MQLKKLLNKVENRRLLENFFSLSLLNIVNYSFPLILIPYLTRVLGVERYGLYAFGFAIINYFSLLVKYGFEFSATKQVAIIREDKQKLSRLFASVLAVRIILLLIAFILLLVLITVVPKFTDIKILLLSGIGIFAGIAIIPIWFFQGMEKMKFVTIINFVARLTTTILVFALVKNSNQYIDALLFQSIGFVAGGILSLFIAYRFFNISLILPTFFEIKYQFKDGWHLFLSTIGMNFYRETNTIILGFVTNFTIVGYYASAEKLIKAIQSVTTPVVNALFPFFSRKLNSKDKFINNLKSFYKIGRYYIFILILITISVLLFAPWGIKVYLGNKYIPSIVDVQIMSFIIVLGGINFYYGIIGLVNMGKQKIFTQSVWFSGLISLITCYSLSLYYNDVGASIAIVVAELVLALQIIYHNKTKLNE